MAQQSIKSLKNQCKNINIPNFEIIDYERGDYGTNSITGLLNNKVKVCFKIPYQSEDENAINNIKECIDSNIYVVKFVINYVLDEDCTLIEYDDGTYLHNCIIKLLIKNKEFKFLVNWEMFWDFGFLANNNEENGNLTLEYLIKIIKKNVKQFKKLFENKNFSFYEYEMLENGKHYTINGKKIYKPNIKIKGCAYGVTDFFIINDFENENINNIINKELKRFKAISKNKNSKNKNLRNIDLREFSEIVNTNEEFEKLRKKLHNACEKYESLDREICTKCPNYNKNNDLITEYNSDFADIKERLSECKKDCKHLKNIENLLKDFNEAKSAYQKFFDEKYLPIIIKFFETNTPKFYNYKLNKNVDWFEIISKPYENLNYENSHYIVNFFEHCTTFPIAWVDNVIDLSGEFNKEKTNDLIENGKKPENIIHSIMDEIEFDYIIVNDDGKIGYNHKIDGPIEKYNINRLNATNKKIDFFGIETLTENYRLFKNTDEKYIVNALLAICWAYKNNYTLAKKYKKIAFKLSSKTTNKNNKVEKLLKTI